MSRWSIFSTNYHFYCPSNRFMAAICAFKDGHSIGIASMGNFIPHRNLSNKFGYLPPSALKMALGVDNALHGLEQQECDIF